MIDLVTAYSVNGFMNFEDAEPTDYWLLHLFVFVGRQQLCRKNFLFNRVSVPEQNTVLMKS
jgi:hypothetical protein